VFALCLRSYFCTVCAAIAERFQNNSASIAERQCGDCAAMFKWLRKLCTVSSAFLKRLRSGFELIAFRLRSDYGDSVAIPI
jgi:hypothetical protein